jgi:hypothetical protein
MSVPEKLPGKKPVDEPKSSKSPSKYAVLVLYRVVARLRKLLRRVSQIMATEMDGSLSMMGYSSLLASYLLGRLKTKSSVATALRSWYSMISDFRMFLRMWGTVATLEWAVDTIADPGSDDPLIKGCTYIQAVSGILYQVLEDVAYLSSKKVIPLSAAHEGKIWVVSCYFWALHVQLELIKLVRQKLAGEKGLVKQFFVNLAWLPLTVHWSTERGFLDDGGVGLFGVCASVPSHLPAWFALLQ